MIGVSSPGLSGVTGVPGWIGLPGFVGSFGSLHGGNDAQQHHPQSQALVPDVGGILANRKFVQEDRLHG